MMFFINKEVYAYILTLDAFHRLKEMFYGFTL